MTPLIMASNKALIMINYLSQTYAKPSEMLLIAMDRIFTVQ